MDIQSANVHANSVATTEQVAVDQTSRSAPCLDCQLLALIGQRDELALASLYDRYSTLIYSIALRITQERSLAETVVQNVFRTVWQSAIGFPVDVNVPMWLSGMARQQALAARDSRTPAPARQQAHASGRDAQSAAGPQAIKVRRALDELPAEQRETIELAFYGGLSCREIAQRLHEPISTVKARLRVGLSVLSKQLSSAAENVNDQNQD